MALTKITSRILDSSGVTILGTIATGVWQGTAINQTYLVGQSGTNTGDETLARINALDITELGTISSGVWNGTAIASAYLDADTAHLSTTQTFTGAKTFSSSVAVGGWIIPNGVNALTADSSHTYLQQPSGGDILLRKSDGTSFVTITNGGNVGIGTASPFGVTSNRISLSVNGTTSSVVNIGTGGTQRGYFYAESNQVLLNTTGALPLHLGTNGSSYLTISSAGNVGIGTDDPAASKLTVSDGVAGYSTANILLQVKRNATNSNDDTSKASIMLANNSNAFQIAYGGTTDRLRFINGGGTEQLTLLNGGNVGIGTTSPSYKLEVNGGTALLGGGFHVSNDQSIVTSSLYTFRDGVYINNPNSSSATATSNSVMSIGASSGNSVYTSLITTGAIGIGTNSPAELLEVKASSSPAIQINQNDQYKGIIRLGGNDLEIRGSSGAMEFYNGSADGDSSALRMSISSGGVITTGGSISNPFKITANPGTRSLKLVSASTNFGTFISWLRANETYEKAYLGFTSTSDDVFEINNRENADMTFHTHTTERMRISSGGYVTKPNQPAFKAGRSGSISTAAGASILFNHVSGNHFNIGGHYNTSNGRFTAPVAGTYVFSVIVIYEGLSTNQVMTDSFYIHKNTTVVAYSFRRANYVSSTTGTSGYFVDHANIMLQLAANDYVHIVNARALAVHGNTNYTYFYGYLLG